MAYDQVVMPGYAAYHIGISAPVDALPINEAGNAAGKPPEQAEDETSPDFLVADDADTEQQPAVESLEDEPEYD